jgi:hypothetical protein
MAKRAALTLSKVDDTYQIQHRGYPVGGLLKFHAALGLAAALLTVPLVVEVGPKIALWYYACTALLIFYAALGYVIHIPFAVLGGSLSFRPKDEHISFSRHVFGKSGSLREIPWEGKLDTEVEPGGFPPFRFYRVKVVTEFMTYCVAIFGPGQAATAEDLAKGVKKARYGRSKAIDFDALKDSGVHRAIKT